VDAKTSADDAEESKPAPDIVEAAVKRSGAVYDADDLVREIKRLTGHPDVGTALYDMRRRNRA
jgi:beta-phosphoglucomutase-like phosphatase (HAD superfamily)